MALEKDAQVEVIPIDSIHILNPRDRDKAKFQKVIDSISAVGLKRTIKVSRRQKKSINGNQKSYNLVCGQGRLEAFQRLGETEIPAIIVDLSEEDCYLQSLIENLARRHHSSLELLTDINTLTKRGYTAAVISKKTGLSREYVNGVMRLFGNDEERLLAAVERGELPITVAVEIATTESEDAQHALSRAYERNDLRGKKLKTAIRIIRDRERLGKKIIRSVRTSKRKYTSQAIVREYKRETERQRTLIRRADVTEARLAVIKSALHILLNNENFVTLMRAEGLETIPAQVAEMMDVPEIIQ